ncbi:MAG: murein biosynthesis integral membrane protein MurJ [Gemmatimonadales bacterium]|nr:MAG: murein biosynthesis integral membrane protein MurJ [Gemmatimonadales bacterium]
MTAGILASRISGLVRERALAHFFGTSSVADAWKAALRMPNVLQNLLGEGTLSASFIPIYASMEEADRKEAARRFAGAIFGLLTVAVGLLALLGIALAPFLVNVFFAGFDAETRALTTGLVRILFPMTAVLVLSAWCLGILNSHRRFLLPYTAPVLWNLAMISALVGGAWWLGLDDGWSVERAGDELVRILAWGALAGGVLQFGVQLPSALGALGGFRPVVSTAVEGVRQALRNFVPVVVSRGAVNLGGWLDYTLASFLAVGAVAALSFAQTLYLLPIALFGMAVAAAELPELSRQRGQGRGAGAPPAPDDPIRGIMAEQMGRAFARVAFFLVPATVVYLLLGDVVVAALYQTGEFGPPQVLLTWAVLAAYAPGMGASALSRVCASAFWALDDTRTPARLAWLRVGLALGAGFLLMWPMDTLEVGGGLRLGAVGLALGSSLAAWTEFVLLRRSLRRELGDHGMGYGQLGRLLVAALPAVLAGAALARLLPEAFHPVLVAGIVLPVTGVIFAGLALFLGVGGPLGEWMGRGRGGAGAGDGAGPGEATDEGARNGRAHGTDPGADERRGEGS